MIKGKRGNKKRQRFAKTARCHEIKRAQTRKRKKKRKEKMRNVKHVRRRTWRKERGKKDESCLLATIHRIRIRESHFYFFLRIFSINMH